MIRTLIVAAMAAMAAPVAWTEAVRGDEKPVEKKDVSKDRPLDTDFIVRVSQCNNNAENCLVVFEKLASSDKVGRFAKDVKKDHDDFQRAVATAVKEKKLAIANTPDREAISALNELRKLEGDARDKAFLDHFIQGHERILAMAEHQKAKGTDRASTELAEKMMPKVKDHLERARALRKDYK